MLGVARQALLRLQQPGEGSALLQKHVTLSAKRGQ
jgi:hypothetical protein